MIRINVAQLLKHPPGTVREHAFRDSLPEAADDWALAAPVEGTAHLLRTTRGVVATVRYRTAATLECARCLNPATVEVAGDFGDEFVPTVDVNTGATLEEQAESDELAINEHHELDLTEVIRQDLLTRLPLQPLCSETCPGLCPHCGEELRQGCSCAVEAESSSPFAKLGELLRRNPGNQ